MSELNESTERLTAWARTFGIEKQPEFIADVKLVLSENERLQDCFVSLIEQMRKLESEVLSPPSERDWDRGYENGFSMAVAEMTGTIVRLKTGKVPCDLRWENERLKKLAATLLVPIAKAVDDARKELENPGLTA